METGCVPMSHNGVSHVPPSMSPWHWHWGWTLHGGFRAARSPWTPLPLGTAGLLGTVPGAGAQCQRAVPVLCLACGSDPWDVVVVPGIGAVTRHSVQYQCPVCGAGTQNQYPVSVLRINTPYPVQSPRTSVSALCVVPVPGAV